ncbi:MAG TPA: hypothetical protein PKD98_01275 [Anaerolineae bacterium]|nr:hypothetical protein [Anaerolineae bacterium]
MPKLFKIFTVIFAAFIALGLSLSLLSALTASASSIDESLLSEVEPAPLAPLFATGGADDFGYTYQDEEEIPSLFDFTDISTGTNLNLDDEDKASLVVATTLSGFDFDFYGQTLSSLVIGNNGVILVNPTTTKINFTNSCDISSVHPDQRRFLAPWWDDWGDNGNVFWALQGTAPNRRLIIQWDNMVHTQDTGSDGVTFQVVLYETSNIIQFNYDDATTASAYNQGNSGTIGILNDDTAFLQYRTCNGGNPLQDDRAVRFSISSITVVKETVPTGDAQSFQFSGTGDISNTFFLDDNADPTYPVSRTFYVVPGVYTIAETLPTDWDVTDLSCSGGATPAVTDTVTATVTLGAGEDVICTYENTKRGSITIAKDATPNSSQVFTFTGDLTTSFTLIDSGSGSYSQTFASLLPGTYTVTEATLGGWDLTAINCNDGDSGTTPDVNNRTVAIDLDPGQDITCTFSNSKLGTLYVRKVTDPDPDPFTTPFTFTASASLSLTPFSLRNGQVFTFSSVTSGTYALTETAVANWTTDSSCSDGSSIGSIGVGVGETVTCTFTNTAATGSITVTKVTEPAGLSGPFSFTTTGLVSPTFSLLADGDSEVFNGVKIGTYAISETVSPDYSLTTSCSDGSSIDSIEVSPNEAITCIFTNTTTIGTITVKKVTQPATSEVFTFTGSLTSTDFTLTNGQTRTFTVTADSQYAITETVPAGWVLTDSACDNGDEVDDITALGGQNITCTFTNTQDIGTVTIVKQTTPDASPQVFTFTTSLTNTGSFTLTDNLSRTFVVSSGSYTVAEQTLAGWSLTTPVSCSDGSPISNLAVQPGEAITCTFANKQMGTLLVKKVKVPPAELPANFSFSVTEDNSPFSSFSLAHNGTSSALQVDPDKAYRVTESTVAGWSTVIGCTNGQTVTNGNRYVDVTPQAGQTVTCTFTNTKQTRLSIRKATIPSPDPTGSTFNFTASPGLSPASFTLAQSGLPRNFDVISGTFIITEAAKAGWDLTDISCTKPGFIEDTNAGSVTVSIVPGDNNVTCVFTNTLQPRTVTIVKATNPATSTETFNFTTNMSTTTNFALSNGLSQTFTVYPGGSYTVTEESLTDWQMNATCDDTDSTLGNISVAIGEDVTCTVTNTYYIAPEYNVYLPILFKPGGCTVDLRITDLSVAGNVVSVEVENAGSCPTDSGFWVDLYADPQTLPSALVGVTADRRWRSPAVNASHGMAWEVPVIATGQTITLKSDGSSGFIPTDVSWPPVSGATIYAFVDSFDNNDPDNATYVEIRESNEANNLSSALPLAAKEGAGSDISVSLVDERRDLD